MRSDKYTAMMTISAGSPKPRLNCLMTKQFLSQWPPVHRVLPRSHGELWNGGILRQLSARGSHQPEKTSFNEV
jgi:hypothetical protein